MNMCDESWACSVLLAVRDLGREGGRAGRER
jgi:hypothetical protein